MLLLLTLACIQPSDPPSPGDPPADPVAPDDTAAPAVPPPVVRMNELSAANRGSVRRDDGASPDWLELYNPGPAAVDLSSWTLSDDFTEPARHVLPPGLTLAPGAWLVLWTDTLPFGLSQDGEGVGLHRPDGTLSDWVTFPPQPDDVAWARLPDGDGDWQAVPRGTPGEANAVLRVEVVELLPADATWRYRDAAAPPPADWATPGFDDAAWAEGAAPLGYGDTHTTTLSYGPDGRAKPITAWFRASFEAPAGAGAARLSLLVDDGAVVWLDGVEWARHNLPAGAIGPDTLALSAVSGDAEQQPVRFDLPGLSPGAHVLAIEVHQADPGSSDLQLAAALDVVTWSR
jgi:hypothetical protein